MNRHRISRNGPCPCGSGRKFKKCCYNRDRRITQLDRAMAIELIEQYSERCDERHDAISVFRGDFDLDVPAMTDHFREISDSAFLFWFAFDFQLEDGSYVVDRILAANSVLSFGERRYLEQMRTTAIMPYEVIAVQPGVSVVLRRIGAQEEIEVREKSASTMLSRWDMLVARLNPIGPTGRPEIEMGAMLIPPMVKREIAKIVHDELGKLPDGDDCARLFKNLGAIFHEIWLETILAPRFPTLQTGEGDPLVYVTTLFDVHDEERVRTALNAEPSLTCEGDIWRWSADDSVLGTIKLSGSQLTLETHSEPRAERGAPTDRKNCS